MVIESDTLDLIHYMFFWVQGGGGTKEGMRWRGNDVSVMFWKVRTFYILFELEKEREYNELREEKSG